MSLTFLNLATLLKYWLCGKDGTPFITRCVEIGVKQRIVVQILEQQNNKLGTDHNTTAKVNTTTTTTIMNVGEVRVAEDTDFALLKVNLLVALLQNNSFCLCF